MCACKMIVHGYNTFFLTWAHLHTIPVLSQEQTYRAENDELVLATLPREYRTSLCRDVRQASLLLQGELLHDEGVN